MVIKVGEKINYSIPSIREFFNQQDLESICKIAELQEEQGADYIYVNVGTLQAETLKKIIKAIQERTSIPLFIDDPDPDKLEAALEVYDYSKSIPILNSATQARAEKVLKLGEKYECGAVLLVSEKYEREKLTPTNSAQESYQTAEKLFDMATKY